MLKKITVVGNSEVKYPQDYKKSYFQQINQTLWLHQSVINIFSNIDG